MYTRRYCPGLVRVGFATDGADRADVVLLAVPTSHLVDAVEASTLQLSDLGTETEGLHDLCVRFQ